LRRSASSFALQSPHSDKRDKLKEATTPSMPTKGENRSFAALMRSGSLSELRPRLPPREDSTDSLYSACGEEEDRPPPAVTPLHAVALKLRLSMQSLATMDETAS
ncbi:hypothetical protein KIPB_004380, partial [Kipferlia bialata]